MEIEALYKFAFPSLHTETPVVPQILSLESTSSTSFTVQWVFPGSTAYITNYTIEIQLSLDSPWTPVLTKSIRAVTIADVSNENVLEPFTEYRVRVVAAYSDGRRMASEGSVVRTGEGTPENGPTDLKGVPTANNTALSLSWSVSIIFILSLLK